MVPPDNLDLMVFYRNARAQGVSITSKLVGVSHVTLSGRPYWITRYQKGGKVLNKKYFPFTKEGEIAAHEAYFKFLKDNNINLRFAEKRKYKKRCKPLQLTK